MRPINLIPEDQRRRAVGDAARTGPLAYLLVGGLCILLVGVVMLVLTSNQISDRKQEVASLEVQRAAASSRADELAPYASFKEVADARTQTVLDLADSRFDWARVIRQVALIVPRYVVLTNMNGVAGKDVSGGSSGSSGFSNEIEGPSLELSGCAKGQNRVAALVAALKQIDGVTRVGLSSSVVKGVDKGSGGSGAGSGCLPRNVEFEVTAAFDLAPPSPDASGGAPAPAPESSEASSAPETSSSTAANGATKTTVSSTTTTTTP